MLLKDYNPTSMLTVKETTVLKPKFPVFDAHIHIGALQMKGFGDPVFDEPKDIGYVVQMLKDAGVFGVINLKMFWGEPLKEHLASLKRYEDFIHTYVLVKS